MQLFIYFLATFYSLLRFFTQVLCILGCQLHLLSFFALLCCSWSDFYDWKLWPEFIHSIQTSTIWRNWRIWPKLRTYICATNAVYATIRRSMLPNIFLPNIRRIFAHTRVIFAGNGLIRGRKCDIIVKIANGSQKKFDWWKNKDVAHGVERGKSTEKNVIRWRNLSNAPSVTNV